MKKLLTLIFIMSTILTFGQNGFLAMNTSKNGQFNKLAFNTQSINLKIPKYRDDSKDKTAGLVLMVAGLAFTTASILEGNGSYGTWTKSPNSTSSYNQTYTTKPFMQQTPRQIMLFVGIGLTISGGVISLK